VDGNSSVFHVLSMSSTGVITDTGNTVAAHFQFWSPNIAMSPNGRVALMANPDGGFVFVLNIDAQHNVTLKGTIPMSGSPWGIDFTPDGTKAYVTVPGSDNPGHGQPGNVAVLSIDASNNVVDSNIRIPIPNGVPFDPGGINGPVKGIALAVDGKAYIANTISLPGNQSTITIVDTATDTVTGTVTVPAFPTDIGVPK
jgi:DNA-binding beta-propeller fold protein YncE